MYATGILQVYKLFGHLFSSNHKKIDIHLENGHGKEHSDKQEVTSVCEFILASGHVSHPCGIVSMDKHGSSAAV